MGGLIECWGAVPPGVTPPEGTFVELAIGPRHICGRRSDGTIVCTGDDTYSQLTSSPPGKFTGLAITLSGSACAVRENGTVVCWGSAGEGPLPPHGRFRQFDFSDSDLCGVRLDGTLQCSGARPEGVFKEVATGYFFSCALDTTDHVTCWGSYVSAWPPASETFAEVIVVDRYASCARTTSGTAECRAYEGAYEAFDLLTEPSETFIDLTAGYNNFACGITDEHRARCWGGLNGPGQTDAPPDELGTIDAGYGHVCGLTPNGDAVCWGADSEGQASPPAGPFTQISAGWDHSCALAANGMVTCWGRSQFGATEPPSRPMVSINAGAGSTCGINEDAQIECWGARLRPQQ